MSLQLSLLHLRLSSDSELLGREQVMITFELVEFNKCVLTHVHNRLSQPKRRIR